MPNRKYEKGRRKEYKIIHKEREKGRLAFRSAGSHSPIDVISIDIKERKIRFIQSKPDNFGKNQIKKIKKENINLNGLFDVEFLVY